MAWLHRMGGVAGVLISCQAGAVLPNEHATALDPSNCCPEKTFNRFPGREASRTLSNVQLANPRVYSLDRHGMNW